MNLILDIKKYIATFNKEAWYWLYRIDIEFREYSSSEEGIREYKKIHYDVVLDSLESNKTIYYLFGIRHREGDLPAVVFENGMCKWYKVGKLHRDGDLPAIIEADGTQHWYINGKPHRDGDLPAVIYVDGTQHWYKNGKLHRDGDLPAIIYANGNKYWFINGKSCQYKNCFY
jgi:hypothetical protein